MRWRRLGRVYAPDGSMPWAQTHAMVPTPWQLDEETLRVFVASVDEERVGRVAYVDVDARNPLRVRRVAREPALDIGEPGTFDEWGVTPMSAVGVGDRIRLYYTGWQRTRAGRYTLLTGVAESGDHGETFERLTQAPILDRSADELYVRSAAAVLRHDDRWLMYYVAGSKWIGCGEAEKPRYGVRTLRSEDGVSWAARGEVCIDPEGDDEFGFGRPWVWRQGDGFRMLYSVRTRSLGYRMGGARSADGLTWQRRDAAAGLDVAADGWDSEMVCFGARVETEFGVWLFYCGNGYGRTGFGVAALESDD